jgi:HD superfamily phosphodiesterase
VIELDRLQQLRGIVNERLHDLENGQEQTAIEHLYSVSLLCGLIAMKRGLHVEVCQCAGLLHDLWLYCQLPLKPGEHQRHAEFGGVEARGILESIGEYSADEIDLICATIHNHNDKNLIHGEYDEALKDADALAHYLRNSAYDRKYKYEGRHVKILTELGIAVAPTIESPSES